MLDLRCDCGYQLHLPDEEARELTWCPRCRKVLVQPPEYAAGRRAFVKRGAGSGGAAGRVGAGIAVAVVLAVARLACVSTTDYEPRNYEIEDLSQPAPEFKFQAPDLPDLPPPDRDAVPPGFLPQPDERNPFPLDREPPARDEGPFFPPRDPDPDDR